MVVPCGVMSPTGSCGTGRRAGSRSGAAAARKSVNEEPTRSRYAGGNPLRPAEYSLTHPPLSPPWNSGLARSEAPSTAHAGPARTPSRPYRRLRGRAPGGRPDDERLLEPGEDLALAVAVDVQGGRVQQARVIAEEPETVVAPLAQHLARRTGLVVVVEVL